MTSFKNPSTFQDYFKLSGVLTTTETPSTTPSSGWKIAKSSQASERKAKQEVEKERGAILMMTVSPHPEYLVKGYDLKALTKYAFLSRGYFFFFENKNKATFWDFLDKWLTFPPSSVLGLWTSSAFPPTT